MDFRKVVVVFLLMIAMVSVASAVDWASPISAYTYENPNVLFDITDSTNDTILCNITYNDVLTEQTFRNETVAYYLEDLQDSNTIELSCNDSTSETRTFNYDSGVEETSVALWVVPAIFLIFAVLLFILFKK